MTDFCEDQWERIAARKELERQQDIKETNEINRLLTLPFHLRIQEKGQEEILQRVEQNQKDTFMNYSVKKWDITKEEALDLFAEYFTEFLNGKVKNIATFLKDRGFKFPAERQGKLVVGQ